MLIRRNNPVRDYTYLGTNYLRQIPALTFAFPIKIEIYILKYVPSEYIRPQTEE